MQVTFVRHGESQFNATQRYQHGLDELSETGERQAEVVAERLEGVPIELIISSPYVRAKRTARVIGAKLDRPIIYSDLLVENKMPSEIEGKRWDDPHAQEITKLLAERYEDAAFRYSDEETFFDIKRRALAFLTEVTGRTEQDILVVTHGMILKMMIGVMIYGEGLSPRMFRPFNRFFGVSNTGLTMSKYNERGQWEVVTWNDHGHLLAGLERDMTP